MANINTDMFLPLFPLKKLTIYGLDESDLGAEAAAAAESLGVEPQRDPEPKRNVFIRSDQYSFIRRGVPALALKVGLDKGSPEEKIQKKWLHRSLPRAVGRRGPAGGQESRRRVRRAGGQAARAHRQPRGTAALEGFVVLQAIRALKSHFAISERQDVVFAPRSSILMLRVFSPRQGRWLIARGFQPLVDVCIHDPGAGSPWLFSGAPPGQRTNSPTSKTRQRRALARFSRPDRGDG